MAAARGHWCATVLLATCLALFALAPSPAAGELVLTPTNPPSGVVLPPLPFGDSAFAVEFWVRLRGRQRSGTVLFYAGDAPAAPPAASPASLSGGTVPPNSGSFDPDSIPRFVRSLPAALPPRASPALTRAPRTPGVGYPVRPSGFPLPLGRGTTVARGGRPC
eukprot:tig00021070_g17817.t1